MDSGTRPARPNVLRWASRPTDDAEVRNLLKRRLAVYLRTVGGLFALMYVIGWLAVGIVEPSRVVEIHLHPGKLIHLGAVVVTLGLWLVLKRKEPTETILKLADLGALLVISIGIGVGGLVAPPGFHMEFALLLGFVFLLVLRSALIPSTAAWTAIVGVICAVPVWLGSYSLAKTSPATEVVTTPLIGIALAVWCTMATIATTVVSHVIYGLVSQVREAQHLGQYTLRQRIGEGGMGEVYRAEHAMLRRPTAIKLLLPARVNPEALARFEREVQLTSRLAHPNTIIIYDYGRTPDGIFYYAMEYLDGVSLDTLVEKDGPQPAARVVRMLVQVAGALAEAHGIGLIHRDIKPGNIMLCDRGGAPIVKVFDFGLVKKIEGSTESVALTSVNAITGTPLYLAPESITHAESVDGRIDIYALGAVAYFLLTGTPPFDGRTVVEICGHHLHTQPVAPSARIGRPVPPKLEALVLSCLAKDRDERPRDAADLLARLSECESESPIGAAESRAWWAAFRSRSSRAPVVPAAPREQRELAGS